MNYKKIFLVAAFQVFTGLALADEPGFFTLDAKVGEVTIYELNLVLQITQQDHIVEKFSFKRTSNHGRQKEYIIGDIITADLIKDQKWTYRIKLYDYMTLVLDINKRLLKIYESGGYPDGMIGPFPVPFKSISVSEYEARMNQDLFNPYRWVRTIGSPEAVQWRNFVFQPPVTANENRGCQRFLLMDDNNTKSPLDN